MDLNFPMEKYGQVKQEMITLRTALEKAKADWLRVRSELDTARANELDEQFKVAFEQLDDHGISGSSMEWQEIAEKLQSLVQQGAAASLLGDYELGSYNLAMLIKKIDSITDTTAQGLATKIIWLTIIAGANLKTQKAYAGNGGAISLEWICVYLAGGIGDYRLQDLDQYTCCYAIFGWIINDFPRAQSTDHFFPFNTFLACLKNSPIVTEWQEKIILTMIYYGFPPSTKNDLYTSARFFSRIAAIQINWLTLLFPFEEEVLKEYISAVQSNLTKETVTSLINAFTSNHKTRKHFKTFFSLRPHWLLRFIVETAPEIIFNLVKRNELEILVPFLKNFKPPLIALRDKQGNSLLHQAVLSRGLVENTIQLLRNSRLSLQVINNEGLTPLALAMKNNRTELIKLLK